MAAPFLQRSVDDDRWARITAVYRQRLQDAGIVGSSLMVVNGSTVVAKAFAGFQHLETKRPVDEHTICMIKELFGLP